MTHSSQSADRKSPVPVFNLKTVL